MRTSGEIDEICKQALEEYLNTNITIDDYIDFTYNHKSIYPDDEEDI